MLQNQDVRSRLGQVGLIATFFGAGAVSACQRDYEDAPTKLVGVG